MCVSGASAAQWSCLAIGLEIVASSSVRSAACSSGKPPKPSLRAMRATVGVETPEESATAVIEPRPESG